MVNFSIRNGENEYFHQIFLTETSKIKCNYKEILKCTEKRLGGNCTRILRATWNKSWKQDPSKQKLYSYLSPIFKTIQIRRTKQDTAGEAITKLYDVLLRTPSLRHPSVSRPTRTHLQQFYADTERSLEDLLWPVDDWDGWREREKE